MTSSSFFILVFFTVGLAFGWAAFSRANLQPADDEKQVRLFGAYSPLLTWLRYRQLPVIKRASRPWPRVRLALMVFSVACAIIGQWLLANTAVNISSSLFWFIAAGLGFVAMVLWREHPERWMPLEAWLASHRMLVLALIGLVLAAAASAALAIHDQAGDGFYTDVIGLWLAGCLVYGLAFPWPTKARWLERWQKHRAEFALVVGLMLLAALLRFLWLDRIPNVMNGDEGLHSNFARGVLESLNKYPFSTYFGAGSLHLFVVSLGLKLLGYTTLASRLTPAIGGVLGVGATYLLARRLFGLAPALATAALVAVLHSHMHFSRVIGVGYIHATLFASLAAYGLYSALETRNPLRAALGGMALGFWLYVYIDSRFVPAVLATWAVMLLILPRQRAFVWDNRRQLAVFAGGYLVAAGPQLTWGLRHLDQFNARFSADGTLWNNYYIRTIGSAASADVLRVLTDQVSHAFLSLTRYPVTDFYQSSWPLLDVMSGALFWLGLIYSIMHLLDRRHLLLQIWLWAGTLAVGLLTVPRTSDGYRMLITFIPVVLILGVVIEQLARALAGLFNDAPRVLWGSLAGILLVIATLNTQYYFGQFGPSCQYSDRAGRTAFYVGQALSTLQSGDQAVMLGNEFLHYGTHGSSQYLNPGVTVEVVLTAFSTNLASNDPRLFLIIPERTADLAEVQTAFPGGQVEQVRDCGAPALTLYRLK